MIIAALLGTFILWKLSRFITDHPPKIEIEVSVPVFEWVTPQETAEQRYHALLAKIDRLPLTDEERELAKESARQRYISEA